MNPYIFTLGNIGIRWYSILILLGIVIAYLLVDKESKKFNLPKNFVSDLAFWVVLIGILGARLWYVVFNFGLYKNDLLDIFAVWNGGLAIHGGIIGGFIALVICCKKNNVSILRMTDMVAPALIIAQAIGRWGNFFNSEAHGPVTTLSNLQQLKIVPSFVIKGMNINGIYYHPTFYYESLWCLLGFVILLMIRKFYKYLKKGQLTCFYLMWYGVGRFFIESLRTDSLMIINFKVAQLISCLFIVIGFCGFIYLCFNKLSRGLYYGK